MKKLFYAIPSCLAIIILFFTLIIPAKALSLETSDIVKERKLLSIAEYKLSEMGVSSEVTIESTKMLYDFIGNQYTIFECAPTGYMIYDNTNGIFTEFSKKSPSPYKNHQNNLFYCGPTNYFALIESTQELVHTIVSDEKINANNTAVFLDANETYCELLNSLRNDFVVDYIKSSSVNTPFYELATVTATRGTVQTNQVPNAAFFSNLSNNFGYHHYYDPIEQETKGICGYIALGLVIAYKDNMDNGNYIPDRFWEYPRFGTNDKTQLVDSSGAFSAYLYETFGINDIGNSTSAEDRAIICERYFNSINKNVSQTYKTTFNKYTIMGAIDDGNPVILGGNLTSPDPNTDTKKASHAVVAYKYTHNWGFWNAPTYTVHYGWYDYSEVEIIGTASTFNSMGVIYSISNK